MNLNRLILPKVAILALAVLFSLASRAQVPPATASKPAPSWVTAIPPGTWSAISLNTLSDVDPADDPEANPNYPGSPPWNGTTGQDSVIKSWNGGAFAAGFGAYGSLVLFGGGHANYFGSEVYSFDLETRTWTRLTNPYAGPYNWPYPLAEYPDGSPLPPHTYDFVEYHPGTNSFIVIKGQDELGPPSNQTEVDIPHLFNLGSKSWRRGPLDTDDPNLFSGGYSAYDSRRDLIWAHGGSGSNNLVSFDPNASNGDGTFGKWTTYPKQLSKTDSEAEYDPDDDIMVVTVFRDDTRVAAIDLSSPATPYVWLNETGSPPSKESSHGWSWSWNRKSILYFGTNGDSVYEFKHTSGDWKSGQWTWKKLTSDSNSVVPETMDVTNGIYSRFRVATFSDAEVALVVNTTEGPVYAFRIPSAITPEAPVGLQAN